MAKQRRLITVTIPVESDEDYEYVDHLVESYTGHAVQGMVKWFASTVDYGGKIEVKVEEANWKYCND